MVNRIEPSQFELRSAVSYEVLSLMEEKDGIVLVSTRIVVVHALRQIWPVSLRYFKVR